MLNQYFNAKTKQLSGLNSGAIKMLCTLGPASLKEDVMIQMEDLGVNVFRLNMSHTAVEDLDYLIRRIQGCTAVDICIDTEGAQIRTGILKSGTVILNRGETITLVKETIEGDERCLTLRPPEVFESLETGMMLSVDFNSVLLLVIENDGERAVARVINGGLIGTNKGVASDKYVPLPSLSDKDLQAVPIALAHGVDHFALSFASNKPSVDEFRSLVGETSTIISKIETTEALRELGGIVSASDAVLIDRGDLSRQVPVEDIPYVQKRIIEKAHEKPIPVYVATNLLESMVELPRPIRAEIGDVTTIMMDGANGLVLAAETAIGKYPVRCVSLIRSLANRHVEITKENVTLGSTYTDDPSGSVMIASNPRRIERTRLVVEDYVIRDIEQICSGAYAPLNGFLEREDINSVLDKNILSDGNVWTLPIVLQSQFASLNFKIGDEIILSCKCCDHDIAFLNVQDIYKFEFEQISQKWFNTTDRQHPGVNRLASRGDCFVGGELNLIKYHPKASSEYSLMPVQIRTIIKNNAWHRVVGFHTRNTPHRAHEYIMKEAMDKVNGDALLIHPGIGQKQKGDFTPQAIIRSYEALLDTDFPSDNTLLSGFSSNSWYAGPREAVFTALCRKNFGCTHFVVGRDHTGVGNYYQPGQVEKLFADLGPIGIEPVFFDEVIFDVHNNMYREVRDSDDEPNISRISGTAIRDHIRKNESPPTWMMSPEVSNILLRIQSEGGKVLEE